MNNFKIESTACQSEESSIAVRLIMPQLTTQDILALLLVCKQWRASILSNLKVWCANLAFRRRGFLKNVDFMTNKRNCFLQLYELHRRRLIDTPFYCQLKDNLGYKDEQLKAKDGHLFMLSPTKEMASIGRVDFMGVDFYYFPKDIRNYTATWHAHLKTLSEDFQLTLFCHYAHRSLHYYNAMVNKVSATMMRKAHNAIAWRPAPKFRDDLDPDYLWSVMPILKEEYGSELYSYLPRLFDRMSSDPSLPPPVQHYFPLLLQLCTCPEDASAFLTQYEGGLDDSCFDQLIAVMPPETVTEFLNVGSAKSFQIAKLADIRGLHSPRHWIFYFEEIRRSKNSRIPKVPAGVYSGGEYLLRERKFFSALVYYYQKFASRPISCCYSPQFSVFPIDLRDSGRLRLNDHVLEVKFIDVYESMLVLLPISNNSIHQEILNIIKPYIPLPSILSTPNGTGEEVLNAQKDALREHLLRS